MTITVALPQVDAPTDRQGVLENPFGPTTAQMGDEGKLTVNPYMLEADGSTVGAWDGSKRRYGAWQAD
jgi:hypothetical protein